MSTKDIAFLLSCFHDRPLYPPLAVVISQGEQIDKVWFIKRGKCTATAKVPGSKRNSEVREEGEVERELWREEGREEGELWKEGGMR